jgi:hypothetical protein
MTPEHGSHENARCACLPAHHAIAYRIAISYLCIAGRRWRRPPAALLGRFLPRLRAAPSGVAFFIFGSRPGDGASSELATAVKRNRELDRTFSRHEIRSLCPRNHGPCRIRAGRGCSESAFARSRRAGAVRRGRRIPGHAGGLDRSAGAPHHRDDRDARVAVAGTPAHRDSAGSRFGDRRTAPQKHRAPSREGGGAESIPGRPPASLRPGPHRRGRSGRDAASCAAARIGGQPADRPDRRHPARSRIRPRQLTRGAQSFS